MHKKRFFLYTSIAIALSLGNINNANAETLDEDQIGSEPQVQLEEKNNFVQDFISENKLSDTQKITLSDLLDNDGEKSDLVKEAINLYEKESYEQSKKIYSELLESTDITTPKEIIELIHFLDEINDEKLHTKDREIPSEKQSDDEQISANKEMTNVKGNENVSEDNKNPEVTNFSTYNTHQQNVEADKLYDKFMNSYFVSDMWSISQEFKTIYPEDPRVKEIVNLAADTTLEYAKKRYNSGDFESSINYFDRIINENLVSGALKNEAEIFKNNAEKNLEKNSANEYFINVMGAYYISEIWPIVDEFKQAHPDHPQLIEAVNYAATKSMEYAGKLSKNDNFENAITYYNRVANENLVDNTTQEAAKKRIADISANNYYSQIKDVYYISEIWPIVDEFKQAHPAHPQLIEAVNYAATKSMEYADKLSKNGNFENAITYYSRVANENLVDNTTQEAAKKRIADISANNYYSQIKDVYYISEIWPIVDEFKQAHPDHPQLIEAVNYAATKSMEYAGKLSKNDNFENAITYYNRVANENLVDNTTQEAAKKRIADISANNYYSQIKNVYYISEIWPIVEDFKQSYPNHPLLIKAIDYATTKSVEYAIKLHNNGAYENAIMYYDEVLNEELVDASIRESVSVYKEQALANQTLKSANDYYNQFTQSNSVSEMWSLAQNFKILFLNDYRLNLMIDHATNKMLEFARKTHNKGNFNQALIYYDRILGEDLVSSTIQANVETYRKRANNKQNLLTEDEYYNTAKSAYTVSDRWSAAIEGLSLYPNSTALRSALNDVATRNLELGRKIQLSGDNDKARFYYNRIIDESKVHEQTRHLAGIFLNQTSKNHRPIVYLDPGHGGNDPGAVSGGVTEQTLNLNVSNYLKNELESRGYIVILSRTNNSFVGLTERAHEANDLQADIFISVHHNSMGGSGIARGIETFIHHTVASGFGQETNRNNFRVEDPRIRESVKLADEIHSNLIKETGFYDRGVKGNNFNVIRNTYIPAVLLELGFMDNSTELSIIRTQNYQRKAANAIADGIDKYFDNIQ